MAKFLTLSGVQYLWNKITNKFVAKEDGKGLSTNDFTNEQKTQLENLVATGGEVNVLEGITVDGQDLSIEGKKVALGKLATKSEVTMEELATALKDIINGKADAATTLAGYGITDAMTSAEIASAIAAAIAGADHMKRVTVASTEEIDVSAEDATQYIYMIKNTDAADGNLYDEYMVIDGAVERVGDWKVDLSEYAKTADFEEITDEELDGICV